MSKSKTLYDKLWEKHEVVKLSDKFSLLYIDLHLIHEVTSPQAFSSLRKRGLFVRKPEYSFATVDHNVSTSNQEVIKDPLSKIQIETLKKNCSDFGIEYFGLDSDKQGIVHCIGPDLGLTTPGKLIVCGDSHTSTHGAFGALAFGIGTSEIETVLATQCLVQERMKNMKIIINGKLNKGVEAKDLILYIISKLGTNKGSGYAVEYAGKVIRNLDIEERMTICNMLIEFGAKCGIIGVDDKTVDYLKNRTFSSKGQEFKKKANMWLKYISDKEAFFNRIIEINASDVDPMISFGTDPSMSVSVEDKIPQLKDVKGKEDKDNLKKALKYMGLKSGQMMQGQKIDYVFIGSCTNARITDLRKAANIIRGKKVHSDISAAWVVPGSRRIKYQAEKEGLDRIFKEAGFRWSFSGCSACIAMNGDKIPKGKYCISTSNRNFEGRQGTGARTILSSPQTAAISAIEGKITDVREYI